MSDEDALIAGIREHPLDDLRRLVYADWLDERGRADEAEYLRLVAALAAPGTAVDVKHPHARRLLALAEYLGSVWREATGGRFDLWFDEFHPAHRITFIKVGREITELGLADLKTLSYTLPKRFADGLPLEEAVGQAEAFHKATLEYRILPTTETPSHTMLRRDIVLRWQARYERGQHITTAELTRAALAHLRRILTRLPETASLTDTFPTTTDQIEWTVTLATAQPASEIARWRKRLQIVHSVRGDTADPPFSGWIDVQADSH